MTWSKYVNRKPKVALKQQPKPVAAASSATNSERGRGGQSGRGRNRGRNGGRGKPKTAQELDAEMTDYFDAPAANTNGASTADANGTTQTAPATHGDTGMDEIMVSYTMPWLS